ncbi:helix-turn-helix domain-containing protein [Porcipelethomonas ammoniilytica]|uniref:helix-turn-helix domain-containing protein n=1 Tax=Porcipelethomonas ammoniilytica TaxID=2981722 RepID=UPI000822639F|nr:helix-turn-helix transcriptional regulator [Porcipelethomonas ammoniilytica]MCU6719152.1 helix-turn-helix domain-containing protein [Porcipelethomonas ammoniilytica]SCI72200.1 Helix-turn-helix domain [uncultured Ruminococcus sp.]
MYKALRLKSLMKQRGISIEKLALDLNLSEENIILFQNNIFNADIDVLILLADYLDVSVDYLMGRTDNTDSHKKK